MGHVKIHSKPGKSPKKSQSIKLDTVTRQSSLEQVGSFGFESNQAVPSTVIDQGATESDFIKFDPLNGLPLEGESFETFQTGPSLSSDQSISTSSSNFLFPESSNPTATGSNRHEFWQWNDTPNLSQIQDPSLSNWHTSDMELTNLLDMSNILELSQLRSDLSEFEWLYNLPEGHLSPTALSKDVTLKDSWISRPYRQPVATRIGSPEPLEGKPKEAFIGPDILEIMHKYLIDSSVSSPPIAFPFQGHSEFYFQLHITRLPSLDECNDFVDLYFSKAFQIAPCIHRKTCTVTLIGPLSLLAMVAIGALYSDAEDRNSLSIAIARITHLNLICCYSPAVRFFSHF